MMQGYSPPKARKGLFHAQKSLKNLIKPIGKYDKMVYNIDKQRGKGSKNNENEHEQDEASGHYFI